MVLLRVQSKRSNIIFENDFSLPFRMHNITLDKILNKQNVIK